MTKTSAREKAKEKDDDRRTCAMVAVAVPAGKVTRPVFGKHGFAGGTLVADWPAIVGSAVAAHTLPLRIKFPPKDRTDGTLVIKVASSAFATELQHLDPASARPPAGPQGGAPAASAALARSFRPAGEKPGEGREPGPARGAGTAGSAHRGAVSGTARTGALRQSPCFAGRHPLISAQVLGRRGRQK
jgi:hypothetical protein